MRVAWKLLHANYHVTNFEVQLLIELKARQQAKLARLLASLAHSKIAQSFWGFIVMADHSSWKAHITTIVELESIIVDSIYCWFKLSLHQAIAKLNQTKGSNWATKLRDEIDMKLGRWNWDWIRRSLNWDWHEVNNGASTKKLFAYDLHTYRDNQWGIVIELSRF